MRTIGIRCRLNSHTWQRVSEKYLYREAEVLGDVYCGYRMTKFYEWVRECIRCRKQEFRADAVVDMGHLAHFIHVPVRVDRLVSQEGIQMCIRRGFLALEQ